MERETLKDLLLMQHRAGKEKIIERELMVRVKGLAQTPFIIMISGVRRCGKSTLLYELKDDSSYYVDFDDERFVNFQVSDFQLMYELLIELFGEKETFLFDEIQNIWGWERFVRRLHTEGKKVYVTGSNATMLSRELGTHLTGRNVMLTLFPFSFAEFLRYKGRSIPRMDRMTSTEASLMKKFFNEYIQKGGFPEYLATEKEDYLRSVYENILYRDIIARYKLPSEQSLKMVVHFTASNIGKELSFNTIRNMTQLTSTTTIREYFEYLENSYLAFLVTRYSPSLKKQIYSNKKAYFIDTGMAQLLGFRASKDSGRMLENAVFLQLKRSGKEIYFHKEKFECDFIVKKGIRVIQAIQVTMKLNEREMKGMMEALDAYKLPEGLILTDHGEEVIRIGKKTITVKPVWKWLLEG